MPPTQPLPNERASRTTQLGSVALGLGLIVVLLAAGALVWSGVATASARISGSTTNENSLFVAGSIDLIIERDGSSASTDLLVDVEGMYPGLVVERCLMVTYRGSIDNVPVRLYGQQAEDSGLERFIQSSVEVGTGQSSDCQDFVPATSLFEGRLSQLWDQHQTFAEGLDLIPAANDETSVTVRFSAEVVDDNAAQGLTSTFWVVLEART